MAGVYPRRKEQRLIDDGTAFLLPFPSFPFSLPPRSRKEHYELGMKCLAKEETARAVDHFQKAVDVTPLMARRVIDAARSIGIECIVAPYEADAQLAYLALRGEVDAVITEDSDLLAYTCPRVRCSVRLCDKRWILTVCLCVVYAAQVLYKLDNRTGIGKEICYARISAVTEPGTVYSPL